MVRCRRSIDGDEVTVNASVELAVAIPQTFLGGPVDRAGVRTFLARAEQLGFHSAWVVEQILGSIPSLEPVTLLTYAAAVTERLKLGSAVLLTALRSPVHLAKHLASLDHLSGGRLIVGVGLGGNPRIYPAFGLPAGRRAARFAEGIRVIKQLWTEPRVTFAGEFYRLERATMEPKPVQKPHPPLWFGAHHPEALRRTAILGDGFMGAGSISTEQFAAEVTQLRGFLRDAGRDPDGFPVGKRVYVAIDRDRDRGMRRLAEWFGAFYGRPELAGQVAVCGSVGECLDGLGHVVRAGARLLMLNPVFDDAEHLERFAAELAPKL
jgi:probable F420-dependent oxidoreductase